MSYYEEFKSNGLIFVCFREQVIKHSLVHKVFLDFFLLAPDQQRAVSSTLGDR